MIDRAAHAAETEMRGNFSQAGRHACALLAPSNEIQNLLLLLGQFIHYFDLIPFK